MEYGGNPPAYVNQLLTLIIKLFKRRKGIIINLLFLMLMLKPISSMLLIGITLNNGFIFFIFLQPCRIRIAIFTVVLMLLVKIYS